MRSGGRRFASRPFSSAKADATAPPTAGSCSPFGLPGATAAGSGLRAVTRVCVGDSRLAPERKKRPARLVADRNELAAAMSLEVKFQTELELPRIEGRRGPAVETAVAGALVEGVYVVNEGRRSCFVEAIE
jgi:hypothetical protein